MPWVKTHLRQVFRPCFCQQCSFGNQFRITLARPTQPPDHPVCPRASKRARARTHARSRGRRRVRMDESPRATHPRTPAQRSRGRMRACARSPHSTPRHANPPRPTPSHFTLPFPPHPDPSRPTRTQPNPPTNPILLTHPPLHVSTGLLRFAAHVNVLCETPKP